MMKLWITVLLLGVFAVAGCRRDPAPQSAQDERPMAESGPQEMSLGPDARDPREASPDADAESTASNTITTRTTLAVKSAAEEFFGSAKWAFREEMRRAEIFCQIGDYASAEKTLQALVEEPGLTARQKEALQKVLAQVREDSGGLAGLAAASATAGEAALSQTELNRAVQESLRRASIALEIEDYSSALAELEELETEPRVPAAEKQVIREWLAVLRANQSSNGATAAR